MFIYIFYNNIFLLPIFTSILCLNSWLLFNFCIKITWPVGVIIKNCSILVRLDSRPCTSEKTLRRRRRRLVRLDSIIYVFQESVESTNVNITLLDTERNLGYLLGLHAHCMRQSLPLQLPESQTSAWLHVPFLTAGLQVVQPPNPYEEEKGEARSTNSTAGNTPTEPKADFCQNVTNASELSLSNITSFINALAESRLSVRSYIYLCRWFSNINLAIL